MTGSLEVDGLVLRKLECIETLHGHHGCVNRLDWNQDGTFLASASDDTNVILWPFPSGRAYLLSTLHEFNIFGVKFAPFAKSSVIITGSMDSTVQLHKIAGVNSLNVVQGPRSMAIDMMSPGLEHAFESLTTHTAVYRCHQNRVKHIETSQNDPFLFWSSSEDGDVRQFDSRVPTLQQNDRNAANVLISLRLNEANKGVNAVSINAVKPEMIAVAAKDDVVRIFDRRMTSLCGRDQKSDMSNASLLNLYNPYHSLEKMTRVECSSLHERMFATYVSFGAHGDKLVATYHGGDAVSWTCLGADTGSCRSSSSPLETDCDHGRSTDFSAQSCFQELMTLGFKSGHDFGPIQSRLSVLDEAEADTCQHIYEDMFDAIRHISRAINRNPEVARMYDKRASCLLDRDLQLDRIRALTDIETAIRLSPENPAYLISLLRVCASLDLPITGTVVYNVIMRRRMAYTERLNADLMHLHRHLTAVGLEPESESIVVELAMQGKLTSEEVEKRVSNVAIICDLDMEYANIWGPYLSQLLQDSQEKKSKPAPIGILGFRATQNLIQTYNYHRNVKTDIKEATFYGLDDSHVMAAADSGRIYIYETFSGGCISALKADKEIVNCVRPHPHLPVIATSGIESSIKIWSPLDEDDEEKKLCITHPEEILEAAESDHEEDVDLMSMEASRAQFTTGPSDEFLLSALSRHSDLFQFLYRHHADQHRNGGGNENDSSEDEQRDVDCRVS